MEAYPDGHAAGIRLIYAVEPEPLDTAGAVRFAATFAGIDETFVVVNGDVLTDLDLTSLVAFHRERDAEGTIALHPVADPSAFGVVPTDDEGRVTAFVEKPPRDEAPTNEINAGTYVLEASVLARIPEGGRVSIERETFPAMVRDRCLFARSDDSYWLDTGTPSAYLEANFDYLNEKRGPIVAPGLVDRGDGVLAGGRERRGGRGGGSGRPLRRLCRRARGTGGAQHPRAAARSSRPGRTVADSVLMDGLPRRGRRQGGRLRHGPALHRRPAGRRPTGLRPRRRCRGLVGDAGRRRASLGLERPDMRTLVTGGAGFIGSNLVDRLLVEGHEVDVVDDFSTGSLSNLAEARGSAGRALTIHHLDISAPAVVELMARRRPELVFHLAAQADVRVSVARPAFDATVNIVGSLNVLEGARQAESERVVFAASGGTLYGEPARRGPTGARVASPATAVALRGGQEGGHRLPDRLPGAARARVLRPRPGQRLRTAAGSPRRGRRGRHLRRAHPARRAGDDLRRRRADAGLRLRRRRRRRLRAGSHPGWRPGLQRRDRQARRRSTSCSPRWWPSPAAR